MLKHYNDVLATLYCSNLIFDLIHCRDELEMIDFLSSKGIVLMNYGLEQIKNMCRSKKFMECGCMSMEQLENVSGGVLQAEAKKSNRMNMKNSVVKTKVENSMETGVWIYQEDLYVSAQNNMLQNDANEHTIPYSSKQQDIHCIDAFSDTSDFASEREMEYTIELMKESPDIKRLINLGKAWLEDGLNSVGEVTYQKRAIANAINCFNNVYELSKRDVQIGKKILDLFSSKDWPQNEKPPRMWENLERKICTDTIEGSDRNHAIEFLSRISSSEFESLGYRYFYKENSQIPDIQKLIFLTSSFLEIDSKESATNTLSCLKILFDSTKNINFVQPFIEVMHEKGYFQKENIPESLANLNSMILSYHLKFDLNKALNFSRIIGDKETEFFCCVNLNKFDDAKKLLSQTDIEGLHLLEKKKKAWAACIVDKTDIEKVENSINHLTDFLLSTELDDSEREKYCGKFTKLLATFKNSDGDFTSITLRNIIECFVKQNFSDCQKLLQPRTDNANFDELNKMLEIFLLKNEQGKWEAMPMECGKMFLLSVEYCIGVEDLTWSLEDRLKHIANCSNLSFKGIDHQITTVQNVIYMTAFCKQYKYQNEDIRKALLGLFSHLKIDLKRFLNVMWTNSGDPNEIFLLSLLTGHNLIDLLKNSTSTTKAKFAKSVYSNDRKRI